MASSRQTRPATDPRRPLSQLIAGAIAATFVLVGILGFVPGITQHLGDIQFASHHSGAELLGIFQVSVLHNLVHLLLGLVGLVMARHSSGARAYLLLGGAAYLVIWAYGLFTPMESVANVVPVNAADNWLHLGLGLGMLALGLALSDPLSSTRAESSR